ncbi:YkyA family protein [Halalkalibacter alkalisediminis]|uniref:YkyA family protein n=1 Tax=Halalkalibacter alkalisediminis TaxID=935616 RepID=A0ABV6NDD2_9BACI|nr:YkyA family protein [Halalkalibacter alkalisediminis]
MLIFKKWAMLLFMIGALAGCGEQPAETIYQYLEAAVEREEPFGQQQEPLQNAELRENEIFEEMIALGLGDLDELTRLANEAIVSVEAREAMVAKEKTSLEESFMTFNKIETEIENIKDEALVSMVNTLAASMKTRYENYNHLHEVYVKTAVEDRVLFEMLKSEELELEELQAQIDVVNDLYVEVEKRKEAFNRSTDDYNQLKREFYEAAGLNVQFE